VPFAKLHKSSQTFSRLPKMICRDSNLCGKRKASTTEEGNDENDMATAAKILKPADSVVIENDDDDNSGGFDKSIESEFKTLKSLIPRIAGKAEIGELEIIDACVSYIESLQDQLRAHDPKILDGVCETADDDDADDAAAVNDDSNNNSSSNDGNKNSVISPKRRNSLRENQRLR